MVAFAQQWLDLQIQAIEGVEQALLLIAVGGRLSPAAQCPAGDEAPLGLTPIAKMAAEQKAAVIVPSHDESKEEQPRSDLYGWPIHVEDQLVGVVAVRCTHRNSGDQQRVLEALSVGSRWLALPRPAAEQVARVYTDLVGDAANCVGQDTATKSIAALLADLGTRYQCERVSFGFIKRGHAEVAALSNAASVDRRSEFMRAVGAAMEEAAAQAQVISYPGDDSTTVVRRVHGQLAEQYGSRYILSVPLVAGDRVYAVVTLERDEPPAFSQQDVAACSQLLAIVAPYIQLKHADERFWLEKNVGNWRNMLGSVFGFRYVGAKLVALVLTGLLIAAATTETDYRITARAVLEGKVQRVISAPLDGFLKSAQVRAGDIVAAGALLAEMDEQDIEIEQASLESQLEQLQRQRREAMANRQLVEMRLASAKIDQVAAELALNRELLERVHIRAPFDGVVIEGDLSQVLGAPLARGETLFKLAPLQGYRVILEVDESDVAEIAPSNTGTIILTAIPEQPIALKVVSITAVAQTIDGRNVFRVEAELEEPPPRLRPGMEGVGKIRVGSRSLLWVWTHELRDWLRLQAWRWLP